MSLRSSAPVDKASHPAVNNTDKIQGILLSLLAVGYVLLQFFPLPAVEVSFNLIILAVIVFILPKIRGSTLLISIFLLLTAAGFMLYHDASLQDWLKAMRVNTTLVALFLFVPLLGIPVRTGGYVEALQRVLSKRMNDPKFFFFGSKLLTHILGVVLNIGAVSIVYQLSTASDIQSPRLVANAINRGFITTIFWSPYFSAMALILSHLPIAWSSIVAYSLAFALIGLLISGWMERPFVQSNVRVHAEPLREDEDRELTRAKRKVAELFFLLFFMMSVVLLAEFVTSYSMVLIICLVSVMFPPLWCFLSGKSAAYRVYNLRNEGGKQFV